MLSQRNFLHYFPSLENKMARGQISRAIKKAHGHKSHGLSLLHYMHQEVTYQIKNRKVHGVESVEDVF